MGLSAILWNYIKIWGHLGGFEGGFWGKFLRFWVCRPFFGIPLKFGVIWGDFGVFWGVLKGNFGVNFSAFGTVRHFMAFHEDLGSFGGIWGSFGGFRRGILG